MSAEHPGQSVVLRHISGTRRGHAEILAGKTLYLVHGRGSDVRVLPADEYQGEGSVAALHRAGDSYELELIGDGRLWVNGQPFAGHRLLESGDLIEVGDAGPVLRFRILPPGVAPKKTLAEAFADSVDGARANGRSGLGRLGRFFVAFTHDLATQTTLWFRIWMLILVSILALSVVALVMQSFRLQKQISREMVRMDGIAKVLQKSNTETMKKTDWAELRKVMEDRLQTLEKRSGAVTRAFESTQGSIAFVQGAFGFVEPDSGRPLRYVEPAPGVYLFTLDDQGQEVELPFTGTAFLVHPGLLLTNRHVAEPWLFDDRIKLPELNGLRPEIRRNRVFFPGIGEAMEVDHLLSSEDADLALLKLRGEIRNIAVLELQADKPQPGDEVLVIGYPLGIKGMLARTGAEFTSLIAPDEQVDFWTAGDRLAAAGYVKPLASRGIVSQLSDDYLVYDAETTTGGSGGPVLDLNGKVVAVNTAIVSGFGGSNLGVLALYAEQLLARALAAE